MIILRNDTSLHQAVRTDDIDSLIIEKTKGFEIEQRRSGQKKKKDPGIEFDPSVVVPPSVTTNVLYPILADVESSCQGHPVIKPYQDLLRRDAPN